VVVVCGGAVVVVAGAVVVGDERRWRVARSAAALRAASWAAGCLAVASAA
jgi:hypothetical protein